MAETHLQNIHKTIKTWTGGAKLPFLNWCVGPNTEAFSGQGKYKFHPQFEINFINYIGSNKNNLYTMMEDAVRYKLSGLYGQTLITALTPLDTLGEHLKCRFFVRRFINLLFPDQFTTTSHDEHLLSVQLELASSNLLKIWGTNYLEQSYYTRQATSNYIQTNQMHSKSTLALSSQTFLFVPAIAF